MGFSYLWNYRYYILEGFRNTLGLAAIGVACGVVLGTVLALMKLSKWGLIRFPATAYIEFVRGTPLMVQVLFVFYGLPIILGIKGGGFIAGAVTLGLNSGAYVAEIIRAGIQSVDIGQMEAARSLGMGKTLSMSRIIMPQAFRNILPALGNEFVVVIKESSIVSTVGVAELMLKANSILSATYTVFRPLIVISLIYFAMTFSLSKLLGVAERNMAKSNR